MTTLPMAGDTTRPSPSTPFADVRPVLVVAGTALVAAAGWSVAADHLPGGRWVVVHLFTLGVLTPLVLGFSQHFSRTLTRSPEPAAALAVPTALGATAVLVGLVSGWTWLLGAGGTVLTVLVLQAYRRLRRMRTAAVGARFAWIVRAYERAHGAFVHGALLGILMGVGVLSGPWYAAARVAHLHVNVLGWGGVTLLATVVFFGPSMVRARIADGAEERAFTAIRRGTTGLSAATVLLLATGIGGGAGTAARLLAAVGLAVLAWAVTVVCRPVAVVALTARRSATWGLVAGAGMWFPLAAWADVAVVATGRWELLTAIGVTALVGVLAQSVLATVLHVGPLLRDRPVRLAVVARLERWAVSRAVAWNVGTTAVAAAASGALDGAAGSAVVRGGFALLGVVVLQTATSIAGPVRDAGPR